MTAPKLDKRTIGDIEAAAEALAAMPDYTPDWAGVGDKDDPGWQLVGLFARMMELLIERVNRVPEKNFLEFLDMVGVEPSPGSAASAPATFLLSNKAPEGGEIPAGTQLATTQTETADAQIFETRTAFFATPARLLAGINLVPDAESFYRLPMMDLPPVPEALEPEPATTAMLSASEASLAPVDHVLYLAAPGLFTRPEPVDVTLSFQLTGPQTAVFESGLLTWRIFDAETEAWKTIPATASVSAPNGVDVTLAAFAGAGAVEIDGVEAVWLACRLEAAADETLALPTISSITGRFVPAAEGGSASTDIEVPIQTAFANSLPLDFSQPVFPFGQRPKYGDAFYVGSELALAPDIESVDLQFTISGYSEADLQALFAGIDAAETITTSIEWQYLDQDGLWQSLPATSRSSFVQIITATPDSAEPSGVRITRNDSDDTGNGTLSVTDTESSVLLHFDIPDTIGLGEVGGVSSYWLRAIARSRDPYGKDGRLLVIDGGTSNPEFRSIGPTFIPPVIEQASITYRHRPTAFGIDMAKSLNNFAWVDHGEALGSSGAAFSPFARVSGPSASFGSDPAIYLGFDRPFGAAFISLFMHLEEMFDAELPQVEAGDPQIVWEYLAEGMAWKPLDVTDGTANLTGSGIISFLGPLDSVGADLFPQLAVAPDGATPPVWYRARLSEGGYDHPPRLRMVLPNSVMADNRATIGELVAGSGNGMPNLKLTLTRTPVLDAEIWVREAEIPSAEAAVPPESIDIREPAVEGGEEQIWIRWTRRPNFLSSEPDSRHYTLEAAGGTLAFGDGINGLIPPIAKDNVVARNLVIGGGENANRLAQPLAVKQLKSSLPFVDKVFNVQGATGGSDPWDRERTLELGPQLIKNKDRAVTTEDFEWLVRANFSQVARVRCLATRSPASGGGLAFTPGAVTLIVVPKGSERTPQPPNGLLRQIADDLRARSFGGIFTDIHTLAPEYLPVRVAATLSPLRPEESSQVAGRASQALEAFLHPLSGGEDGAGWGFGRSVYLSEIFAVLQAVEGVDHVVEASLVDAAPSATSLSIGEHALVASGSHEIGVV